MAVLWQDTCRDLKRLFKFLSVTANSNMQNTTVKHFGQEQPNLINVTLR